MQQSMTCKSLLFSFDFNRSIHLFFHRWLQKTFKTVNLTEMERTTIEIGFHRRSRLRRINSSKKMRNIMISISVILGIILITVLIGMFWFLSTLSKAPPTARAPTTPWSSSTTTSSTTTTAAPDWNQLPWKINTKLKKFRKKSFCWNILRIYSFDFYCKTFTKHHFDEIHLHSKVESWFIRF